MRHPERVSALRDRLVEERVGALMVCKVANIAYVTGFEQVFDTEEAHAAVITPDGAWLYTDSRYAEAAMAAAQGTEWHVVVPTENLYITACTALVDAGIESLALESSVPYGRFRFISEKFGGNVVAIEQWVEDVRQVKGADEIERVAAAQAITDTAFTHILGFIRPGITEIDIALELEFFMRKNGSDGVAFAPIVASGPNSAKPHASVTDRAVQSGDFLKMDFGARYAGYCSDMTRTVVVGRASDKQREVYEVVRAANEAGISALKAGVPGHIVDRAARDVIEAAGYGENFRHGLGHGVGLEIHESPSLGMKATKSVHEGSVVTIEPGIYLPGFGGVRIEDLAVVESDGCRVLTTSTKDLLEL